MEIKQHNNSNSANSLKQLNIGNSNNKDSDQSFMSTNSNTPSNNEDDAGLSMDAPQPQKSTVTEFVMKQRNIGPNGAYTTAQKLKKHYSVKKVDLSENAFQDEGIIYTSIALKSCLSLVYLNVSHNFMTHYGFRILLENVNMSSLRHLDVSANPIGNNGMDSIAKFLEMTDSLEILNLSSTNIEEEGAKKLGVAISLNASLKKLDLSWNHIRAQGAAVIGKGLVTNNSIEEADFSYNGFAFDGALAMSECIKFNRVIKVLDMSCNRLTYDCATHLANALHSNQSIKQLNLSNNPLTTTGVYHILSALNNDQSHLEYLGLKNVAMLKHVYVIIELIQQKRQFVCDAGPIIIYSDNLGAKIAVEEDPMLKLSKYLIEKRLRLIDMFRILDKRQIMKMDKDEFAKRLKIFEPRLKTKDIFTISDALANGNVIEYSNLFRQVHQTKSEIIAQENSIIKLRLQTLRKNKQYMKSIESQFNHMLNQSEKHRASVIIDDWLKEAEEEEKHDKSERLQQRKPSRAAPLPNRATLLRSDALTKELMSNTTRSLIDYGTTAGSSPARENSNRRKTLAADNTLSKSEMNFSNGAATTLPKIGQQQKPKVITPRYNNTQIVKKKAGSSLLNRTLSKSIAAIDDTKRSSMDPEVKINIVEEDSEPTASFEV